MDLLTSIKVNYGYAGIIHKVPGDACRNLFLWMQEKETACYVFRITGRKRDNLDRANGQWMLTIGAIR